MNADATGRLVRYDARTKEVAVLRAGLPYPNSVVVSTDRTHVVVAQTVPAQAFRYWLRWSKARQYKLLADLPLLENRPKIQAKNTTCCLNRY